MKTINTRFGQIEYDPDNLLFFPEGMIGLPQLRHFIVMPNQKQGPLFWIQCVDDPDIAFVLTNPGDFFLDYAIMPDDSEREKLGIAAEDEYFTLAVVTVPPDQNITLNLSAPILFAPKTNKALQVVLDDPKYKTKTPLPK
ncbi:flagellar assembly protein FliW [Desulfosediminicola flagellatus]|uniref:flagellar assembly protein FliW n=1 Tax=Desulfosediminicola flagellatus TaxID=2569541 RepID=UPI0010AC46DC|nr:flagellar assembly protein FliW [Desulfosediminicola flagellatus]